MKYTLKMIACTRKEGCGAEHQEFKLMSSTTWRDCYNALISQFIDDSSAIKEEMTITELAFDMPEDDYVIEFMSEEIRFGRVRYKIEETTK